MDNGRWFVVPGNSETSSRVHASLFTGALTLALEVTNTGSAPLDIRPDALRMTVDRDRTELARRDQEALRCHGHAQDAVTLAAGESCAIHAAFSVRPDADRLAKLTLTHEGVTRDGAPVSVSVKLEKD